MEVSSKKTRINKKVKEFRKEEFDYHDVVNENNKFGVRKTAYIDTLFRPRLSHVTFSTNTHPKSQIIRGMAYKVFFAYVSIIVEELFKGNTIKINKVGLISLLTMTSNTKYRGRQKDRERSKKKGFYTRINCDYFFSSDKIRYGFPYASFGKFYKKKLHSLEDNNIKF